MAYTDAQGRPEIFMHPEILAGKSTFSLVEPASGDSTVEHPDNNNDNNTAGAKKNRRPPPKG